MAILASQIIASLRLTLLDPSPGVTFTDAMFLAWLGEVERRACELRPELLIVRAAIPMVAGTLQAVPAGGTAIMRLDQNVTSKRRCRLTDAESLDMANLFWPTTTASADVREWCHDDRDRTRFHVWPPNNGAGSVVALYGTTPAPFTLVTQAIHIDDVHDVALKDGVLAEAYGANTKRGDMAKMSAYRAAFEHALGINAAAVVAVGPKVAA